MSEETKKQEETVDEVQTAIEPNSVEKAEVEKVEVERVEVETEKVEADPAQEESEQTEPVEQTEEEKKNELRSGIKEVVANDDLVAAAKAREPSEDDEDAEDVFPSFFIEEEDREEVKVDILYGSDGTLLTISRADINIDFSDLTQIKHSTEKFSFSLPTYDDMVTYRKRCSRFNPQANREIVDGHQMRLFLLVWHLKDWSLTDRKGNKIELEFDMEDDQERLSKKSQRTVMKTLPALIDVVLTIMEKDILLT